jgi:tRNA splicing endonuclease
VVFMIIERYGPGKAVEVYRRFRDHGRMAPSGVRYIASWVDLDFRRCFQVMEAESEAMLKTWTDEWDDLVEFEIIPVRASEEAARAIAPEL